MIDRTVKLAEAFRRRDWLVVNVKVSNAYGIKWTSGPVCSRPDIL